MKIDMKIEKNTLYIGAAVLAILIAGYFYVVHFSSSPQGYMITDNILILGTEPYTPYHEFDYFNYTDNSPGTIMVFISGAVYNPGVYELADNSRVIDVLEMGGGATAYADLNRINLAAFLSDAQHIIIPTYGEEVFLVESPQAQAQNNLININIADQNTLQTLPGIGPVISQNIVNHRENNGPFTSVEQIQNVNRIGPAIFENIRHLITVN